MVIMDQPILSILLFSAVLALIVFAFGYIVQAVSPKNKETMSFIDFILLVLFFAAIIYALKALNVWQILVVGI